MAEPNGTRSTGTRASARHVRTTVRRSRGFAPRAPAQPLPPPTPPSNRTGSLIDRQPVTQPLVITHELSIEGELAEQLWDMYVTGVTPLAELAVLKHLDTRDTVIAQLRNQRITKLVAWQGNEPIGLGLITNSLDDVDEISPTFLRTKYPDFAARDAIYVAMLIVAAPGARGITVFSRISTEMWQVPGRVNGLIVFDVCEFNRVTFDAEELGKRVAGNFPNATVDFLDRQTWYIGHVPEPLPEPPRR
jgi:hypothetical protein